MKLTSLLSTGLLKNTKSQPPPIGPDRGRVTAVYTAVRLRRPFMTWTELTPATVTDAAVSVGERSVERFGRFIHRMGGVCVCVCFMVFLGPSFSISLDCSYGLWFCMKKIGSMIMKYQV